MNLESCTERQMLEVGVAAAIQKTYMARHDLKAAKTDKSAIPRRSSLLLNGQDRNRETRKMPTKST